MSVAKFQAPMTTEDALKVNTAAGAFYSWRKLRSSKAEVIGASGVTLSQVLKANDSLVFAGLGSCRFYCYVGRWESYANEL